MTNQNYSSVSFDNRCWPSSRVQAPCHAACPVGTNPAEYIMAIHMEDYDEAFRIIARENPLPGVCGRLCHHPCEDQCVRNHIDRPVAIRALKRFAIEKAEKTALDKFIPMAAKTGQRVAIVGGGPSGLAAARDLTIAGHEVTVFEKSDYPGGI
ncbi:MAG: NAD(P)-binding protein, partial [bacterium]|nr:NAD(P)-binding protein [bacterium]